MTTAEELREFANYVQGVHVIGLNRAADELDAKALSMKELQDRITELAKMVVELREELDTLKKERDAKAISMKELQDRITELAKMVVELREELEAAKLSLDDANKRLAAWSCSGIAHGKTCLHHPIAEREFAANVCPVCETLKVARLEEALGAERLMTQINKALAETLLSERDKYKAALCALKSDPTIPNQLPEWAVVIVKQALNQGVKL